ncbi:hypothetical protein NDU88_006301 [Pleurodeles waltl]|uniref:Uncharacterized protein n=1 Tax=Pleurodeles waltl TaxID=8319 RepID=A0AAV7TE06_PLEWA|nr:hypothetical protein NDU88_006301 [Pleurodeles waltl]
MRPQPRTSRDRLAGSTPQVRWDTLVLLVSGHYSEFRGGPAHLFWSRGHCLALQPPLPGLQAAKSRSRGAPARPVPFTTGLRRRIAPTELRSSRGKRSPVSPPERQGRDPGLVEYYRPGRAAPIDIFFGSGPMGPHAALSKLLRLLRNLKIL